jgi:hypothetical protein
VRVPEAAVTGERKGQTQMKMENDMYSDMPESGVKERDKYVTSIVKTLRY